MMKHITNIIISRTLITTSFKYAISGLGATLSLLTLMSKSLVTKHRTMVNAMIPIILLYELQIRFIASMSVNLCPTTCMMPPVFVFMNV